MPNYLEQVSFPFPRQNLLGAFLLLLTEVLNKGIMTEALSVIIPIAFDELNLHRLEANIMPSNQASIRVVEKLGFYQEGYSKEYLFINGSWRDHIHMVLISI